MKLDTKAIVTVLFALLLLAIYFYPTFSGMLMLLSIILFGVISTKANSIDVKILSLIFLLALAVFNLTVYPVKYGIDFKGGVRIPLLLEDSVSQDTMGEIVDKVKQRVSSLGLKQISVKAVGDNQIYVEIPENDEESVKKIEDIVKQQGVYEGIVDGKVAISGKDIVSGTVYRVPSSALQGADWGVAFSVTPEASESFAKDVKGKAGKPLYMYLDRPKNALILLPSELIFENINGTFDEVSALIAIREAVGSNELIFDENFDPASVDENKTILVHEKSKWREILSSREKTTVFNKLPEFFYRGQVFINKWETIGLLSAPILSQTVTDGIPMLSYTITGSVSSQSSAVEEAKFVEAILKGGSLPMKVFTGSKTSIPAKLGEKFLYYSIMGLAAALVLIAIFVSLRYKKIALIGPMLFVTVFEVIVLYSAIGSFTLDLAAMAGIIAAIGVSIDAQIVITDELLKRGQIADKMKKAFEIINANVWIIIIAMVPLLFSSLIEVIGFAVSTMLGGILGALVSRPAYAVLVDKFLHKEIENS